MSAHDVNEQTGMDMLKARRSTTIALDTIRSFLHNGEVQWETRSKITQILERDAVFDKARRDFMSRTERYTRGIALTNRVCELQQLHSWTQHETSIAIATLDEQLPINIHNVAFQPVFMLQASAPLLAKYSDLIATKGILGCYLQTELGHGTNVSRLETTATFIPETQEFEIHSPTTTSSKWWIGGLGKTATHGVVQAKLILPGGKDLGPHLFFVQLRSMHDHKVLSGIKIGDIGPKALAGFSPTDHGFALFDHVRIPKEHMLSKFAQVTKNGEYVKPPHAKLSYGGMLYIRANMVTSGGWLMAKAATVAIRYATVRRQGEIGPDGLERQIITYPSVYYRILPVLSHAYVFIRLGKTLTEAFDTLAGNLAKGDTSSLAEMHAITSGLKVVVSSTGVQDLEVARRSMGGHGYSAFSGLGRLYADYLPSVTYEGDNFVLDQQVVRAALKSYRSLFSESEESTMQSLLPSSHYLRLLIPPTRSLPSFTEHDFRYPTTSILLLEWRAALIVEEHARTVDDSDASINQRVAKAVTEAFIAAQIGKIIDTLGSTGMKEREQIIVGKVYLLYLVTTVEAGLVDLLSFNILNSSGGSRDPTRSLRMTIQKLCTELLPEAIGLSDAFGFTDWELDSALGVYDGKVYDALWKRVQSEPLNQTEVPTAYEESIKPMLLRGQRQARSKL